MALPVTFASLSTVTLSQFDQNFAALGALTPIPCGVAGTNALTLSPLANTPAVAAYANYMQFTGVASATSTGAVTAQVGSLPSLNVYVDTSSGPVQATTQIIIGTAFTLMYDSSLNSGAGGFHLQSAVVAGAFLPLAGGTLTGALTGTTIALSGPLRAGSATLTGALVASTISATIASGATVAASALFSGASMSLSGAATIGTTLSATKLAVGGGNPVTRMLWTTATLTFGAIGPNSSNDQTIALAGCLPGDQVMAGVPSAPTAGIVLFPFVSGSSTIVMRALNGTTATLSPPAGVYQVNVVGND